MIDKIKTLSKKLLGDGSSSKKDNKKNQLNIIGFYVKSTSMVQLTCEIN